MSQRPPTAWRPDDISDEQYAREHCTDCGQMMSEEQIGDGASMCARCEHDGDEPTLTHEGVAADEALRRADLIDAGRRVP